MSDPVKVFLFEVEPGARRLFFAEPAEPDDPSKRPAHEGIRGWAETKIHSLMALLQHSESSAARFSRAVWRRLQRTTHPDEALLARLRGTEAIDIHHPASLSHDETLAAWSAFLGRSRRRDRKSVV